MYFVAKYVEIELEKAALYAQLCEKISSGVVLSYDDFSNVSDIASKKTANIVHLFQPFAYERNIEFLDVDDIWTLRHVPEFFVEVYQDFLHLVNDKRPFGSAASDTVQGVSSIVQDFMSRDDGLSALAAHIGFLHSFKAEQKILSDEFFTVVGECRDKPSLFGMSVDDRAGFCERVLRELGLEVNDADVAFLLEKAKFDSDIEEQALLLGRINASCLKLPFNYSYSL